MAYVLAVSFRVAYAHGGALAAYVLVAHVLATYVIVSGRVGTPTQSCRSTARCRSSDTIMPEHC